MQKEINICLSGRAACIRRSPKENLNPVVTHLWNQVSQFLVFTVSLPFFSFFFVSVSVAHRASLFSGCIYSRVPSASVAGIPLHRLRILKVLSRAPPFFWTTNVYTKSTFQTPLLARFGSKQHHLPPRDLLSVDGETVVVSQFPTPWRACAGGRER